MTSVEPLKLYVYEDGLVRFATKKYSSNIKDISNNMIHLTNYSINKDSSNFVHSTGPGDFTGHKWNLKSLWEYLEEKLDIDWRPLWEETKDICMKTILCGLDHIQREVAAKVRSEYNCYKLFGFDVIFDSDLKPWLLEVIMHFLNLFSTFLLPGKQHTILTC